VTFFGASGQVAAFFGELVVHSTEWTTGSQLFRAFDPVSALSRAASGPLDGVDHWLMTFPSFWPSFGTFPRS